MDWRDACYYEHTYCDPPLHVIPPLEGVRTDKWRFVRYTGGKPVLEQLVDLENDPFDVNNLASEPSYGAVLARLRAKCAEMSEAVE